MKLPWKLLEDLVYWVVKTGASFKTWPSKHPSSEKGFYLIKPFCYQNTQAPCGLSTWDLSYIVSIIEVELAFVLSNVLPWASTSSKYISFPRGQLVKCFIWGMAFIMLNQLMSHDPNWASHLHTYLRGTITSPKAHRVSSPFAQKLILLMVALVSLSIHPMLQCPVLTFLNHHGQAPRSKTQTSSSSSSIPSFLESNYSLLSILGTSREPKASLSFKFQLLWFPPPVLVGLFFADMRDAFLISWPCGFYQVLF